MRAVVATTRTDTRLVVRDESYTLGNRNTYRWYVVLLFQIQDQGVVMGTSAQCCSSPSNPTPRNVLLVTLWHISCLFISAASISRGTPRSTGSWQAVHRAHARWALS